ncbi:MAG: EAL domain-containing protein [Nitrosomonadales bacterium]|nr:EAL domain-containing protein [Nitrosomonadales bacterium]
MFRLLRYFSIASLISMVLAAVVLGMLHKMFEKNYLLRLGENQNAMLTQFFANNLWPQFRGFANTSNLLDANALRSHPDIARLSLNVRNVIRNTPTVGVQIYQLDGRMLFSTDAAQIGTRNGNDAGFLSARKGLTQSEIAHHDKFSAFDRDIVDRDVLSSYIPLRNNVDGSIEGVMNIYTDVSDLLASDEREERLVTMSEVAVLVTLYVILFFIVRHADNVIRNQSEQKRRIEQNLNHLATHDLLTNLPNRVLLLDRIKLSLAAAERHNNLLAVAVIDLDNLQSINNSLGHLIGDKVLQTVAQRLVRCLRESDTTAHHGSDEFIVSLPDIHSNVDLFQIAKKMLGVIAEPIEVDGRELHVTASIGIALYPEHAKDAESLIRKAGMAMHSAKRLGRNRHQMFTEHMDEEVQQQVQIEDEMWRALKNNEFVLYYQPIIDLKSGAIVGAEALLRWPNPHGTWISPAEFIPMTEQCGLIVSLSEWVLSEACAQFQTWRESGLELDRFTISVHLSRRHFVTTGLATMIAGITELSEIDPRNLHIEISDGLLTDMNESILANFDALKRMGIKFSLDNFGAGYSSLGYLRSFPIDMLKINRSFIQDIPDDADHIAIVSTIIALANSLNLTVVAKGVETATQLSSLQQLGCHQAQGFLFSRPLPADDFLALAMEQRDMRITQSPMRLDHPQ